MPTATFFQRGWLDAIVVEELSRHHPEAALARLPAEVRGAGSSNTDLVPGARLLVARSLRSRPLDDGAGPAAAFREEVRLHVDLLLDLETLRGDVHEPQRRRAEMAAFLAAALGQPEAFDVLPTARVPPRAADVDRAFAAAEEALAKRFHPPGDPVLGLPLHPGAVAILRRRLARVAAGYHRSGRLDPAATVRHAEFAGRESVLLVEALAGLLAAEAPPDDRARAVRKGQLQRLGLWSSALREAKAAVAAPRAPAELARAAPEQVQGFLAEQLFLAQLRAKLGGDGPRRFVDAFVAAAALDPSTVAAARVEAAAQHGDHQVWFEAIAPGARPMDWQAFVGEWGAATDAVVERVSSAVTDNLGAVVREIRETGELGQLLARAASGQTLTAAERKKVRAQLIDLAKAVPALAIFAAPGGMLLLPLLAKLLPFSLLPSAWERPPRPDGAGRSQPAPDPEQPAEAAPKPEGLPKPAPKPEPV